MPDARSFPAWDIFCRVVDNFGDAAVSWRLARQLAAEHGFPVRLWMDHLPTLTRLNPEVDPEITQQLVDGVDVRSWDASADVAAPADVVVDAFGCGLPEGYLSAMTARTLWITLEYLSAESWVTGCHGLPSPHPRLPLSRYFFFPGFRPGTGGVLREGNLLRRRDAWSAEAKIRFWRSLGFTTPVQPELVISLFAYDNYLINNIINELIEGPGPTVIAVPAGLASDRVRRALEIDVAKVGTTVHRGALEVRMLPFLPQSAYDGLLWSCDLNFVRGEDSFVRAQWASRPFVWQAYPQADEAHAAKVGAFLDAYCEGLSPPSSLALREVWGAWNGIEGKNVPPDGLIRTLVREFDPLRAHAAAWSDRLAVLGDLAGNLAKFCLDKLK